MSEILKPTRRGFITGLTSLLVAPSIVRVENLMPVKVYDPYNTRYLVDYIPYTDSLILRVDRALHELPMPSFGMTMVESEVFKYIPKEQIFAIQPPNTIQRTLSVQLPDQLLIKEIKKGTIKIVKNNNTIS